MRHDDNLREPSGAGSTGDGPRWESEAPVHLGSEALARLVDDPPSRAEQDHLEACDPCRAELDALAAQRKLLRELPPADPPPGEWGAIEARLALDASGRVARSPAAPASKRPVSGAELILPGRAAAMRAAAGLVLFLAGGVSGALLSGAGPSQMPDPDTALVAAPVTTSPVDISELVWQEDLGAEASEAWIRRTQRWHMEALMAHRARLAGAPAQLTDTDPLSRLVLTENILAATEAAVREAPTDPFFNGLLVSTEAERRATFANVRSVVNRNRQESP